VQHRRHRIIIGMRHHGMARIGIGIMRKHRSLRSIRHRHGIGEKQ
jgi:hypothetical protein